MLGTPGIGKTWNLIAVKLLHDKRIPFLTGNASPKDSVFGDNFKIFYFHALTPRIEIFKQMLNEVKTDFGKIPSKL